MVLPSVFSYSLCTKSDCLIRKLNQLKGMVHWRSEVRHFLPLSKEDIQYNGKEGKGFHFLTLSVQLSSRSVSKWEIQFPTVWCSARKRALWKVKSVTHINCTPVAKFRVCLVICCLILLLWHTEKWLLYCALENITPRLTAIKWAFRPLPRSSRLLEETKWVIGILIQSYSLTASYLPSVN